jgi:predicted DNA-binding mobile mystery protein A
MRANFKQLRLRQLARSLLPFRATVSVSRPQKGWVRALREALGVSSGALAERVGATRQLILQQEKAEAEDRISLKSLRGLASALDCDLVYALVPRESTLEELQDKRERETARKNVLGVAHTMVLENQATGNIEETIETETQRLLRKRLGR